MEEKKSVWTRDCKLLGGWNFPRERLRKTALRKSRAEPQKFISFKACKAGI